MCVCVCVCVCVFVCVCVCVCVLWYDVGGGYLHICNIYIQINIHTSSHKHTRKLCIYIYNIHTYTHTYRQPLTVGGADTWAVNRTRELRTQSIQGISCLRLIMHGASGNPDIIYIIKIRGRQKGRQRDMREASGNPVNGSGGGCILSHYQSSM